MLMLMWMVVAMVSMVWMAVMMMMVGEWKQAGCCPLVRASR